MVERRLTWLAGIALLWGAAIFCKLVSLQVLHHREYARMARARQEVVTEISAPRGTIFDRAGRPLAMSVPTESVFVNPLKVPDLGAAADLLALVLHMDRADLFARMQMSFENHRGFLTVKRKITADESRNLRDLHLDWVDIRTESQRHYPNGSLAAHVLGGVDFEERGNAGVEKALDPDLRGQAGEVRLLTDVKRRGIDQEMATEARPGLPLTISIDERIQFVAEREIAAAVALHHAASGSVVVMNPYNGQILAEASVPTYDPNRPPESAEDPARVNHAIGAPFEPGSVFKVVTFSAALETTRLRPDSPINCHGGVLTLFNRTIHDSHGGAGILPMQVVLWKSSNIGAIQVGLQVGRENLYQYVRRFGFGQKTGVPLPGESKGRLRTLDRWGATSIASISIGHEVSVTTLQLAQAGAVIANGGLLVKPSLVVKKGAEAVPTEPPVRVIKAETAITMRQLMEGVVLHGTGTDARLEGYTAGGKTGSAQIYDYATKRYSHDTYNGSFMGFAPVTNPAIVVVVTLNGSHGKAGFGGPAAAPVFRAVATEALRVLDVPKDLPDEPLLTAQTPEEDRDDLAIADLGSDQPNILEDKDDEDQPAAAAQTAAAPATPKVPNFNGMTMRAVLSAAAAHGITVLPEGSGVVRVQYPPAGSVLHQGERIRVRFAK
jgi:cell division protein FtsI (penicillin-binding protein 3)